MTKECEIAVVPTGHATRYLQALCKHWARHLPVTFSPRHGKVTFRSKRRSRPDPTDATARLDAFADMLIVRIDASGRDQLDTIKQMIVRHLNRFALREGPLSFEWSWIPERTLMLDPVTL